jgi:coronin-7
LTVPRLHKDYFQDDIFIPTIDLKKPLLTVDEWVKGIQKEFSLLNLRPTDMPLCKLLFTFLYKLFYNSCKYHKNKHLNPKRKQLHL